MPVMVGVNRRRKCVMRITEADVQILSIKLLEQDSWSAMNKAHVSSVPEYNEQKRFIEIAKCRQIIQHETAGIEQQSKAFHAA